MKGRFRAPGRILDPVLTLAFLGLTLLGLALIYSTTYYQEGLQGAVTRQGLALLLGLCLQWLISRTQLRRILSWSPLLYTVSLLPLLAVAWLGVEVNGARRWLSLGPLGSVQPSEWVKFSLLLVQAHWVSRGQYGRALLALLLPALLVLRQPDLGTVGCYAASTLGVFVVAGVDWRLLLAGGGLSTWLVSLGLHSYQKERLLMFLDPERDPQGAGWNLIQAKIAVGSGGLQGAGYLGGLQKRLMFVPEQHTDFLFTVLAEELGFWGGLLLILLFGLLLLRGLRLAESARSRESRILCASVCLSLGFQFLVNLSMVLGLFPVTGIPLPFLSYGGTALVTQCALLGLLQSEARAQWRRRRLQSRLQWSPRLSQEA